MIINLDREPKYSLYYIGAIILEQLKAANSLPLESLFDIVRAEIDTDLSIDFVYYTLDWLYLLSLIRLNGDRVGLC